MAESAPEIPGSRSARPGAERGLIAATFLALVWAAAMFPLLSWGLPDRSRDPLLFGGNPPWSPERFNAAAALNHRAQRIGGADTDADPLTNRSQIIDLTATDADRAAILRRYRLFTRQPDEMITLMALQRMKPRQLDFDPRLYQYGGAYIYLVGAMIGVAKIAGFVTITSDVNVYLRAPELFAPFYFIARLVSLAFAVAALVAVYRLGRRAAGIIGGFSAMVVVAMLPVFITGALEAKPHLPSACMLLWATISALDYLRSPRWRYAILLGIQTGLAFGLVLTGLLGVALIIATALCAARGRHMPPAGAGPANHLRRLITSAVLFAAVYAATNPYVIYNAVANPDALRGNLGNSTAMYTGQIERAAAGAARIGQLTIESVGWPVLCAGILGFIAMLRWRPREALLASSTAIAIAAMGVLLGAGKPYEYARFLLLPSISLAICAAVFVRKAIPGRRFFITNAIAMTLLIGFARPFPYLLSFVADATNDRETRRTAAEFIEFNLPDDDAMGVVQEPAPYSIPPLDFSRSRVLLLPATAPDDPAANSLPPWLVLTADDERAFAGAWWLQHYHFVEKWAVADNPARITWANKPVYLFRRD